MQAKYNVHKIIINCVDYSPPTLFSFYQAFLDIQCTCTYTKHMQLVYSGTSHNGPSKERTASI